MFLTSDGDCLAVLLSQKSPAYSAPGINMCIQYRIAFASNTSLVLSTWLHSAHNHYHPPSPILFFQETRIAACNAEIMAKRCLWQDRRLKSSHGKQRSSQDLGQDGDEDEGYGVDGGVGEGWGFGVGGGA